MDDEFAIFKASFVISEPGSRKHVFGDQRSSAPSQIVMQSEKLSFANILYKSFTSLYMCRHLLDLPWAASSTLLLASSIDRVSFSCASSNLPRG
jgi:hypothetical protein